MLIIKNIEETLDTLQNRISWSDIAKAAGLHKSTFSHFKKGTEITFYPYLINVAKFIYNDKATEVLKNWCLNLKRPINIKYALEYLSLNNCKQELGILLYKIETEHSHNKELLEWLEVYKIYRDYINGSNIFDILHSLGNIKPKTEEMKILAIIIELYCFCNNRDYNSMIPLCRGLEEKINSIEDVFIRKSFNNRLKELMCHVYLHYYNDVENARKNAEYVIKSKELGARFISHAYYILGMSFLFEDYDKCLGYIMEYRKICENAGSQHLCDIVDNKDIPFINNVWGKYEESPRTNDISEIAHYEATKGDKVNAIKLVEQAIKNEGTSGFKLYYKALATGDKKLFMESLVYFVNKKGGKFYARLPYKHLKDDPIFGSVAKLMLE